LFDTIFFQKAEQRTMHIHVYDKQIKECRLQNLPLWHEDLCIH